MTTRRGLAVIAAATGLAAVVATAALAGGRSETAGADANRDLARARQATEQYHDVGVAEADGYVSTDHCVEGPAGGMGVHYVNHGLFADGVVDLERPDVLLYVPQGGRMKLVAVEYVAIDGDQDPTTDDDRPSLFGQAFHGPFAEPDAPVVFTLHAWLWQANPAGILAEWNPSIRCPA